MAEERIYNIPLRNAYNKERVRRAKKAMAIVKEFLKKHMKSEKLKIGKSINEKVWSRGAKKPPRKIRIHTIKEDEIIYAEIVGVDIKTPTAEEKKAKEKKEEERKKKIKEAREERKKMTLREELDESGKTKTQKEITKEEKRAEVRQEKKEEDKELKKRKPHTK